MHLTVSKSFTCCCICTFIVYSYKIYITKYAYLITYTYGAQALSYLSQSHTGSHLHQNHWCVSGTLHPWQPWLSAEGWLWHLAAKWFCSTYGTRTMSYFLLIQLMSIVQHSLRVFPSFEVLWGRWSSVLTAFTAVLKLSSIFTCATMLSAAWQT